MRKKPTASSAADMASETTNIERHPNCVSAKPETVGLTASPTAMTPLFSARRVPRTSAGEFAMMTLVTDGKNKPVPTACTRRLANNIGEVLRNQRERASERKRPRPDEEHAAQPETAQHERRQHDGRRGNHHVPDDHPVRDGERDAEALRQLGQGDVHHALPERGREGARQQHG